MFETLGVWLINLPSSSKRRERMEEQLRALGLKWHVFQAINGSLEWDRLVQTADVVAYEKNMGSKLLPGKLGVYASHLAVWEAFVESQHETALILEDDVVFHENFLDSLKIGLELSPHWDILRFNAIRAKLPITQGCAGIYKLNAYVGPFTGNATYLIQKETASKLVGQLKTQTRALDHELNRFFHWNYRLRGLEPFSSHPDDGNESTITGNSFDRVVKRPFLQRRFYYQTKVLNYFKRAFYLFKTGALLPRQAKKLL